MPWSSICDFSGGSFRHRRVEASRPETTHFINFSSDKVLGHFLKTCYTLPLPGSVGLWPAPEAGEMPALPREEQKLLIPNITSCEAVHKKGVMRLTELCC